MGILGIRCLHSSKRVKRTIANNRKKGRKILSGLTDEYRAFCDSPIPYEFETLDIQYPGSRFICTVRPLEDWIISRINHFGGDVKTHRAAFRAHNARLVAHFGERQKDILFYRLCEGEGWEPLCEWLGVPVPDRDFPHMNKTPARQKTLIKRQFKLDATETPAQDE